MLAYVDGSMCHLMLGKDVKTLHYLITWDVRVRVDLLEDSFHLFHILLSSMQPVSQHIDPQLILFSLLNELAASLN